MPAQAPSLEGWQTNSQKDHSSLSEPMLLMPNAAFFRRSARSASTGPQTLHCFCPDSHQQQQVRTNSTGYAHCRQGEWQRSAARQPTQHMRSLQPGHHLVSG
jgi:hypothetical protein